MSEEYLEKKFAWYRVFAVAGRVLLSFRRDHRTFAMMIIMPIFFMFIFGVVFRGDINNVAISVEVQDQGFTNPFNQTQINFGQTIVDHLKLDNRVNVHDGIYLSDIDKVESTEFVATILFDTNFTENLLVRGNATIAIYIDSTKPRLKASVYGALSDALQSIVEGRGINFDETVAFDGAEFTGLDVSIPGVMGYILTFLLLLIAVLTAIREDISKTKMRLFVTPLTPVERILGYALALIFFAMLETFTVLCIAIFVFHTVIRGSLALLFFVGFLYGIAHIFLAFFLVSFAKNEFQSIQLVMLVAFPSLLFSGMVLPVSSLPTAIRAISAITPMTYGIRAFEGIMLRGWGITEIWFELILISVLAVVFFILALVTSSDVSKD